MNQAWETVVATALLGTDRQNTLPALQDDTLKALLAQGDEQDCEGWILNAAAILSAYRQAGQKPQIRPQLLRAPAESTAPSLEETPYHSVLRTIFTQNFQPTLPELVSLLQETKQCVPPEFLPQLLDWGSVNSEVQTSLQAVIGPRGHWLAEQNPKWRYAQATPQAPNPAEWQTLWETSDRPTRLNLLREWRRLHPDVARELVATTWKKESARDRTAFLECFDLGLSLADAGFLEAGLEDRSKEVQSSALDLLSKLPQSSHSQALGAQVKALISVKETQKNAQITQRLEVALPALEDPQWQKYVLDVVRFKQDLQGNRAALLFRIISLSPLSIWADFGTPQELLGMLSQQKWKTELTQGWLVAAHHQRDLDWSLALLDWATANLLTHAGRWRQSLSLMRQLLADLPDASRHQWVERSLNPEFWQGDLVEILISNQFIFPLTLSHTVLQTAQEFLVGTLEESQTRAVAHKLQYLSNILHPDVLCGSSEGSFEQTYHRLQASDFSRLWDYLRLRQQMHHTILGKADPPE